MTDHTYISRFQICDVVTAAIIFSALVNPLGGSYDKKLGARMNGAGAISFFSTSLQPYTAAILIPCRLEKFSDISLKGPATLDYAFAAPHLGS